MDTPTMFFLGPQFILNIKLLRWANFLVVSLNGNENFAVTKTSRNFAKSLDNV